MATIRLANNPKANFCICNSSERSMNQIASPDRLEVTLDALEPDRRARWGDIPVSARRDGRCSALRRRGSAEKGHYGPAADPKPAPCLPGRRRPTGSQRTLPRARRNRRPRPSPQAEMSRASSRKSPHCAEIHLHKAGSCFLDSHQRLRGLRGGPEAGPTPVMPAGNLTSPAAAPGSPAPPRC